MSPAAITFTKLLLQEPKLETITRETIETFRGQRTECKFTTEKKDFEDKFPADLIEALTDKAKRTTKRGVTKVSKNVQEKENYYRRETHFLIFISFITKISPLRKYYYVKK